jgi:acetylornithine deacetylase
MKVEEILRELVAIPTPSSNSNLPLLRWVEQCLKAQQWQVQLLPYTDENGIAKANLMARPGHAERNNNSIGLAFICHTDTVPYAASWSTALKLGESPDGLFLHGCGACDVKGSLACFLDAVGGLTREKVRPDAAVILTADEEIGCKGMEQLLGQTHLRIRSALVSEPTSLRPGVAGKGYGLARVTIKGIEAHSAYPREGRSAIHLAARFITRLENATAQHAMHEDPLFDPPFTTTNVGVIQGGSAKNIIAGWCTFLVEWRPVPADLPRATFTQLEQIADELRGEEPGTGIEVELLRAEQGFAPSEAGALQSQLSKLLGAERTPMGISFSSEASRLAAVADEVIVIGPGDMHTAHSERECVPRAELHLWVDTLRELLQAR